MIIPNLYNIYVFSLTASEYKHNKLIILYNPTIRNKQNNDKI